MHLVLFIELGYLQIALVEVLERDETVCVHRVARVRECLHPSLDAHAYAVLRKLFAYETLVSVSVVVKEAHYPVI